MFVISLKEDDVARAARCAHLSIDPRRIRFELLGDNTSECCACRLPKSASALLVTDGRRLMPPLRLIVGEVADLAEPVIVLLIGHFPIGEESKAEVSGGSSVRARGETVDLAGLECLSISSLR